MVDKKVEDYRIIRGTPNIVESMVKHMIGIGWEIKGDLIPTTSRDGTPIVLQNMVHYGADL